MCEIRVINQFVFLSPLLEKRGLINPGKFFYIVYPLIRIRDSRTTDEVRRMGGKKNRDGYGP